MMLELGLVFLGVASSALFSGFETGLYAMERVRMQVRAASGDWRAARLLHWWGRKSRTVLLLLIGNNITHWLAGHSFALLVAASYPAMEIEEVQALALAWSVPILFVVGEVLPKSLFLRHPSHLMPLALPPFEVARVVLLPLAGSLGWMLKRLFRAERQINSLLGREELATVIAEAEAAGQLNPTQRKLAERVLDLRRHRVATLMVPFERVTAATGRDGGVALRHAMERSGHTRALVLSEGGAPLGYVTRHDLAGSSPMEISRCLRPLPSLHPQVTAVQALDELRRAKCPIGLVSDGGRALGIVSTADIVDLLFRSGSSPVQEIGSQRRSG
jgi:CBS domain containing-hemolysin-like protein